MQPINKYLVVNPVEEQITTASGLLMTSSDTDGLRYRKGVVVKPGTNVDCVKEGDVIYYDKNAGFTMMLEGNTYTIILERDVVVVL
jgi:co-chaperonin GroES (HSP10)